MAWGIQLFINGGKITTKSFCDDLTSRRVTRYLDKMAEYHGYPLKIQVDNGQNLQEKPLPTELNYMV
ncbi:hypothetical protein A9G24_03935 [Gilliamella sp. App6-5]|jgi:hypothetical protein|uniref:hypothetical protein n=1 Tax=Gilliamella sp. App6-5 TaxID=3120232 RepID=UPI00080EADF5|nr:hypothetical protein [Gilliamella apicola]OCG16748.1 hypothetical protein A9G24_03935 [Gilliamella apicola]